MHQLAGFTHSRNEVVPAPRNETVIGQTEDPFGNRVTMMMVVEKPAIEALVLQRCLNCIEIHDG